MPNNLLGVIEAKKPEFSKGQRLIADYITNHYDKAAFMTALKLGTTVGVSESTVVRFAFELGFNGYPQLQRVLQEMIKHKLTSVQRIDVANDIMGNGDVLEKVLNLDIEKIKKTLEETSKETFKDAVNAIASAKKIYILGARSASALASFMAFYFNLMFDNVKLISSSSTSEMFEQIIRMQADDVIIGISFPRYSKKTVNAMHYAKNSGAKAIAITDSEDSPLAKEADFLLKARSDMASFVDSLVAPLSLINALIVSVGQQKNEDLKFIFNRLENIWDEYDVYEKTEDNNV